MADEIAVPSKKLDWKLILAGLVIVALVLLGIFGQASFKSSIESWKTAKSSETIRANAAEKKLEETTTLLKTVTDSKESLVRQVASYKKGKKIVTKRTVALDLKGNVIRMPDGAPAYNESSKEIETASGDSASEQWLKEKQDLNLKLTDAVSLSEKKDSVIAKKDLELAESYKKTVEKHGQFRIGWGFEPAKPLDQGAHLAATSVIGSVGFWGLVTTDFPSFTSFRGLVGADLGL